MPGRLQSIDLQDIECAIRHRFRWQYFNTRLEHQFETDVGAARCQHMRRHNLIGLLVYHFFLFGDYKVVGDVFTTDLFVHFAIMTPIMIAANFKLASNPPPWLREGIQTISIIVLAATIVGVGMASVSPNRDLVLLAVLLVILFAAFMQRLRFWYAVAACLAAQTFYSYGLTTVTPFSMDRTIMSNSVFISALLFSLFGTYRLECEERTGYLLRLRDRIRNRELEIMSFRDALTGIGNRHALTAAFEQLERARRARPHRSTSIVLLDIDHFKLFNDTNGHQEGDACLRQVAAIIADGLRQDEGTVYRFGGEEFLILLDDTTLDAALLVAERIRLRIGDAALPRDASKRSFVSISAGVCAGRIGRDATPESLIAEADAALYAAKRQGRDRVWPAPNAGTVVAEIAFVERLAG